MGVGMAVAVPFLLSGCGSEKKAAPIKILWADWQPSEALADLCKLYTRQTGIPVQVIKKSWDGAFTAATLSEFRNRDDNYDIIVGDSQWLGLGAEGGHYLEITDWIPGNVPLDKLAPGAFKWYCEYPKGSGRAYAVPCEGDAMAWAYRRDLFEDPGHRRDFQEFLRRNQVRPFPLDPPATWDRLRWIAQYFKEAVPGMAGLVLATSRSYDMATMSFEQILWAMGGSFGNYATEEVTFDSPESVRALRFFNELLDFTSPGGRNLGYGEVVGEFVAGRAAMMCNYFAFMPSLLNPLENPDYHAGTGFFNSPAMPDSGVMRRFASLGGQGMSVNAHISVERQHRALALMGWFSSTEVQRLWAERGGFTLNLEVMRSPDFLKAAPYNPLFEEAFGIMRDFWSIPEFDQLMAVTHREICDVIQEGADPEKAAARIQADHERILARRARRLEEK
jgi:multiple sugar transport system substrate-binding protein